MEIVSFKSLAVKKMKGKSWQMHRVPGGGGRVVWGGKRGTFTTGGEIGKWNRC